MLRRKMFRTLWRYKAQFLSMVIMIALGVGVFLAFNIEWYSLEKNTKEMFEATGFADYRIYAEKGFSEQDLQKVRAIDGVQDATRYLSINTAVEGDTDTLALTVSENMDVSGFLVLDGEAYDPESTDGIWLSDRYASANGLKLGDVLTLSYRNVSVSGTIRGLGKSSEYLICLPDETQLMPDYSTYGYAYISPVMLKNAIPAMYRLFIGDSMYYQMNVKSTLEKKAFIEAADAALGRTLLILSVDETISYAETQGEIEEGQTMGSILPVLFLAIAMLTMVTTMHRITASEKTQIGTLKALGFRDRKIVRHYTFYALTIGVLGTTLGIAIGYGLAFYILNPQGAMGTYIDMPSWKLYMPGFCVWTLVLINLFLVLIGFLSVRKMLEGTAADALKPYTPRRMKHLKLEETQAFKSLSFGTKWNLRDGLRHKSRTLMTLFGILGCMILLVGGLGMQDTMNAFVDVFFDEANHYALKVNLDTSGADNAQALALCETLQGDWVAQSSVQVEDKAVGLEVDHVTRDKLRFVDENMERVRLTDHGAYISARIAKEFDLHAGDPLTFTPYGGDQSYTVEIEGVLRSLSESIYMTDTYADSIGVPYTVSAIYTDADTVESPLVMNTQTKQTVMDSFESFMEIMRVMIVLLVVASVILGIVVLYNLGVMSYTERYREMATLKVIGFRDGRIKKLLIGQNLWLSIIGILLGLPAGAGVLQYLLDALASEYEMKMVIGWPTYLVSILLTLSISLIVGLMIARKNRQIDMVAALKTEE